MKSHKTLHDIVDNPGGLPQLSFYFPMDSRRLDSGGDRGYARKELLYVMTKVVMDSSESFPEQTNTFFFVPSKAGGEVNKWNCSDVF